MRESWILCEGQCPQGLVTFQSPPLSTGGLGADSRSKPLTLHAGASRLPASSTVMRSRLKLSPLRWEGKS